MSNHVNTDLISITFYNKDTVDVLLKDCEEEVRTLLKAIVENTEVRENTEMTEMTVHHTIQWGERLVGIKDNCSDAAKENGVS